MASREQLMDALVRADEAGDTESAALFADELRKLSAAQPQGAETPAPTPEQPGFFDQARTTAADVLRLASNGATFGFRDKMAAGLKSMVGDESYADAKQAERAATEGSRERIGPAGSLAAEVGGNLATGYGMGKAGLTVMDSVASASTPFIKRLLGSAMGGSIEGAAYGGLDAAGHDRDIGEGVRSGGTMGAMIGPAMESALTGLNRMFGRGVPGGSQVPTMDQLSGEVNAGYKRLEDSGVSLKPETVANLNQQLNTDLVSSSSGPRRGSHPRIFGELDALSDYTPTQKAPVVRNTQTDVQRQSDTTTTRSVNSKKPRTRRVEEQRTGTAQQSRTTRDLSPDRGMSLYDLEEHRKAIRNSTKADPTERLFGNRAISSIDDFASKLDAGDIVANPGANVKDAVGDLQDTRRLAHRKLKLEDVAKEVKKGERTIDASDSRSPSSVMRGRIKTLLDSDKRMMGFSDAETQQMEDIIKGTRAGNAARSVAGLMGSVPGYVASGTLGASLGGAMAGVGGGSAGSAAGILAATGLRKGANAIAERSTDKQIEKLLDTIALGRVPDKRRTPQVLTKKQRDALTRSLLINDDD